MDEAEKRRELRRQKILSRSQNRMKIVMGHENDEEAQEHEPVAEPFVIESMRKVEPLDEMQPNPDNSDYMSPQANVEGVESERKVESRRKATGHRETGQSNLNSLQLNSPRSPEESSLPPQLATLLQTLQSHGAQSDENEGHQLLDSNKYFSKMRTTLCGIIGILVRLSFFSSIGPNYVQTALNPFIAYEIAILGYQRAVGMTVQGNRSGNLWLSALALSGVNQDFINTYKHVTAMISAVVDDFTIYFFAFTAIHLFA